MAASIVIDAGHGGYDSGASYQGRREKDKSLPRTDIRYTTLGRRMSMIPPMRRRRLPMQRGRIILYPYTAIPARTPIPTAEWRRWCTRKIRWSMTLQMPSTRD